MSDILIRFTGREREALEIVSGHIRCQAALTAGIKVNAIDPSTGKRYEILKKDNDIIAVEIVSQ